jgi:hypothetical protein
MEPQPYWTLGNCKKYLDELIEEMLHEDRHSQIKPASDIFRNFQNADAITCGIIIGATMGHFAKDCLDARLTPKKIEFALKEGFERRLDDINLWYAQKLTQKIQKTLQ